ncbi:MAG: L-histidine N(alpha)-methyltransferase [Cryomorphaceae bacterium]|nr:L-histidine N(alpha)-methyltransferase [Flavobacteriales bacterium]
MSFSEDVAKGLSGEQKKLPSKYFYDADGDRLFQEIMKMPEYYLTNSEYEIFSTKAEAILKAMGVNSGAFNLVEFGAGDGFKTKVLIERMLELEAQLTYAPIDISKDVLDQLEENFLERFPGLNINPQNADYFEALERLGSVSDLPKLVLFIGSSIGNFSRDQSIDFLKTLNTKLRKGDKLLIGFDLRKNPKIILDAYNDREGITKAFNLNLLKRINRELGGKFDVEAFDHYPLYDPEAGLAKSYIVSLKEQDVYIESCQKTFHFGAGEAIHTEISRKFSVAEIEEIAEKSGFVVTEHFFDCRHYYVNTLIELV